MKKVILRNQIDAIAYCYDAGFVEAIKAAAKQIEIDNPGLTAKEAMQLTLSREIVVWLKGDTVICVLVH